jgi:hypothetical protein
MSELTVGQLRGLPVNNNIVTVPSGHTLYAPGHVIQVVNVDYLGRAVQGIASNVILDITGLEARITPKSANSRIVIQARWFGEMAVNNLAWDSIFGVSRNGVQIGRQTDGIGSTAQNGITTASVNYEANDANSTAENMSLFISDLPGTTSELVYRVTFSTFQTGTLYTNRTGGWTGQATSFELGTSSIMLMEIAQ